MKYIATFFSLFLFLSLPSLATQVSQNEVHFLSHPAPSPDGNSVVFSFEGDLWKVDINGGLANRLTAMDGAETHARFSPDGNHIAFSARQDGNASVYVMPVEGGNIKRLTWHDGSNLVNSWSWDSELIRFSSDRYNYIDGYEVQINGNTPRRLINEHFFNIPHDITQHPQTGDFFFTDTWESFRFYERKRYRGPFNPVIRSFNPSSDTFTEHTTHDGKNMWPSFDREGVLYYISDEYNNEYNLFRIIDGEIEQLTFFESSISFPQVSADGNVVVFEKDYRIWKYDVASGESAPVPIYLNRNPVLELPISYSTEGNISGFDVSPDNKKLAFISRGELFVSDVDGNFVRQLATNPSERVSEVLWLNDDELLYTQTSNGYHNLYRISAKGDGSEIQITNETMHHRNPMLSPNGDKVAYFRGRNDVQIFNIDRNTHTTLHQDELWTFRNYSIRWSPDGNWIAFNAFNYFEQDILVANVSTGEVLNLTNTGVTENNPSWSADGKYIYFTTDRIQPSYPRGNTQNNIHRIALTHQIPPLRKDRFDALFADEEEENNGDVTVQIDTENMHRRWEQVVSHSGSQSSPYVIVDGDKHILIYGSSHDGSGASLWKTVLEPFKSPQTSKIDGSRTFNPQIRSVKNSHYLLARGTIHKLNLNQNSVESITINHSFTRNLMAEFNQLFHETWANIEENFYDENFHDRDWNQLREYYAQFLPFLNNREDLRRLTNDMLGELNSSHMGFNTSGDDEEQYYKSRTIATGIMFQDENPFEVERFVSGSNADNFRLADRLQPGDRLLSVNGKTVDAEKNREFYFNNPDVAEEVELVFSRGNTQIPVRLRGQSSASIRNLLYDEWMDSRQEVVDTESGNRIAYIHMKNMNAGELRHFQQEVARQFVHRDALILDLRYNRGGNVHDDVINTLSRAGYLNWQFREGSLENQPNFSPADKPLVVLINEQSLSDAEMTAAGLRQIGLGTIIGMPTYRWIIFTTAMSLVDGSSHRLPAWGVYDFEGNNLEMSGVDPHIKIRNSFHDLVNDRDPQLTRAISYILDQLD